MLRSTCQKYHPSGILSGGLGLGFRVADLGFGFRGDLPGGGGLSSRVSEPKILSP